VMGQSPLTAPDARQSAILLLRTSSHRARRGGLKEVMHSDAFEATQCGKLPNTLLLSVAFRLLYHGYYECGEIRGPRLPG
jgi:hypothetical protein